MLTDYIKTCSFKFDGNSTTDLAIGRGISTKRISASVMRVEQSKIIHVLSLNMLYTAMMTEAVDKDAIIASLNKSQRRERERERETSYKLRFLHMSFANCHP